MIALATPTITAEQIQNAEDIINSRIREGRKVTVAVYKEDTPEEQLKEVRTVSIIHLGTTMLPYVFRPVVLVVCQKTTKVI